MELMIWCKCCMCVHACAHAHTRALVHAWVEHAQVDECGFLGREVYLENLLPVLLHPSLLLDPRDGSPRGLLKLDSPGFPSSSHITRFVNPRVI